MDGIGGWLKRCGFAGCFSRFLVCADLDPGGWKRLLFSFFPCRFLRFCFAFLVKELAFAVEEIVIVFVGDHHTGKDVGSVAADDDLFVPGLFGFPVVETGEDQLNVSVLPGGDPVGDFGNPYQGHTGAGVHPAAGQHVRMEVSGIQVDGFIAVDPRNGPGNSVPFVEYRHGCSFHLVETTASRKNVFSG